MVQKTPLTAAYDALRQGTMSRRAFVARAAALGVSASLALALVNSVGDRGVAAQDAPAERPEFGTQSQSRGEGGELRVRQWFAPDNAVAHLTDFPQSAAQVSSLILEPLLSYGPDGSLLPTLVTEIPTRENGGLSDDFTTVILTLRDDVVWSDGEPLIASDVVWTWQWISQLPEDSVSRWVWSSIQSIEQLSPTRVQLTYAKPTLGWFAPIAGAYHGAIIPGHLWTGKNKAALDAQFALDPIGTGPYRVETIVPGDHIACTINERYRESNKPYFETVRFQGGGDSASDAQAVLLDGDGDVTSDLRIPAARIRALLTRGGKGRIIAGPPTDIEQLVFNFSDPNQEIDGERAQLSAPHPFLTDRAVRQAMTLAIDRETIANEFFLGGDIEPAGRNVLTGIAALESSFPALEFDLEQANELLDRAGWTRVGDTRVKEGIELAVSYYTTGIGDLSPLVQYRLQTQALVRAAWESIGIKVQPGQVSAGEFFNVTPENVLSFAHFYRDVEMFSDGPMSPWPDTYFSDWYAGPGNENIAQRANDWLGGNFQRYIDPEFDALYEESIATTDPQRAAELFIEMNDRIVGDCVVVPLVARPGMLYALSNRIAEENIALSSWEPLFWNIANWRTANLNSEPA